MFRNRASISDYYKITLKEVKSEILRESDATIIGTNIEELTQYYFDKYCLEPILFDETQEITWDPKKHIETIPAHEREWVYQSQGDLDFECEKIDVEIPIIQNERIRDIAELESSNFSISYSEEDFSFTPNKITFSLKTKGYGFSLNEDQIPQNIDSQINRVKELISWKNKDIENENSKLKSNIFSFISNRVKELNQNKEKLSSLTKKINIPLKKKEDPTVRKIELSQKPIIRKVKPTPTQPEEYSLDQAKVLDIISFLDNQGKQFEKTPKSYESMGEDALRDVLLVNLNSIFEGKATGETFSKKGKTDIYLNIDKGNILVFECKIWKGENLYHSTINQLRGYLTWRHNFGVMITFSRNKNFSEILAQIKKILEDNKSYIGGYRKVNETHFVSRHSVEGDTKEVEIHHLFYNL